MNVKQKLDRMAVVQESLKNILLLLLKQMRSLYAN
jgi:hypothetical protein